MYVTNEDWDVDERIKPLVDALRGSGIENFELCQRREGRSFLEPTIRLHGDRSEGLRALVLAQQQGLPVTALRMTRSVLDGEPTGPSWELTFASAS